MTDVIAVMREWLDLVATGPAEAWPGKVAADVVIRLPFAPPGVASELSGFDQAIAALSSVWSAKERFAWRDVVIRRTEDPELLVTTARSEALMRSGQAYANAYVMLTRIRDGKVVEHVEYFNPLPVLEVYGRGP
jgi:ketosteroid isomerase-like protein